MTDKLISVCFVLYAAVIVVVSGAIVSALAAVVYFLALK